MKSLAINNSQLPERLKKVLPRIEKTFSHSKRKNTRKAYASDVANYENFCKQHDIAKLFPAEPATLLLYLDNLAHEPQTYRNRGKSKQTYFKYATIKRKFHALRAKHVELGMDFCGDHPTFREYLKSIGEEMLESGAAERVIERAPDALLRNELRSIIEYIDSEMQTDTRFTNKPRLIRDRALLLLGFAGAFRRSELANLSLEHIRFVEEGLEIELLQSKNKTTVEEKLRKSIALNTERRYCPKRALTDWLEASGIQSGPVFRSLTKGGKLKPQAIDGKAVDLMVKKYAKAAGLTGKFGAHSLRSGFVTQAKKNGHSLDDIRRMGWKSIKTIDERYNQNTGWENNPSVNIT